MTLAIFDLDNTLLGGDSDYLWGQYLVDQGIVDRTHYGAENERFYQEYVAGTMDIQEFLRFQLRPLTVHEPEQLRTWREDFLRRHIEPIVLPAAQTLLAEHRARGHTLLIITATNSFLTRPIADLLGVAHLLATEPQTHGGRYTGEVQGVPCYREGKVQRLQDWLRRHGADLQGSWFYSDSHNDLPLLEQVTNPVAVDPDPQLRRVAQEREWPVISLRAGAQVSAGNEPDPPMDR